MIGPRLFLVALLIAGPARAWGPEGHAIVADIAEAHLTPAAAAEIHRLLAAEGHARLDEIASWADAETAKHPEMGPWHYVDIPLAAPGYDPPRDCAAGRCVIAKLVAADGVLADPAQPAAARAEALNWVVHLAGDIHQPLHAADRDDKGGNAVKLAWFGTPSNLHAVWDLGIIEHANSWQLGPDYSFDHAAVGAEARRLDASIDPADRLAWSRAASVDIEAAAIDWATESHALAAGLVYPDLPEDRAGDWSASYAAEAWPVVEVQLERAGVRLAAVLNRALAGSR
jgi:hypothetical protein